MEITKKNTTTFSTHLTKQYGRKGSKKREEFEVNAKAFLISELVENERGRLEKSTERTLEKYR
jgi:HTH-type transcriptional regulator/antitoxin HipB